MARIKMIRTAVLGVVFSLTLPFVGRAADLPTKAMPPAVQSPASVWSFSFTPYLWMAGLSGTSQLGPRAPQTDLDLEFSDIFDHLKFAAMGTAEFRSGRFGAIVDLNYLSLSASGAGPSGYVNARLEDKTFIGTFSGAYRVVDDPSWWLDVVGGARVWSVNVDLGFDIVPVGVSRTYGQSQTWADPVIGVRARTALGSKFFLEGYADVGGFGVSSKSTWQIAGLVGYQYSPTTSLMLGYRHLAVDYDRDGFVWDVRLSGPIVAVTFKLN